MRCCLIRKSARLTTSTVMRVWTRTCAVAQKALAVLASPLVTFLAIFLVAVEAAQAVGARCFGATT